MKKNKLPRILLALLVSACLWLYVVTVVDPNDTKTIYGVPVTYEEMDSLEENHLIMTSGQNATVSLKFSGRRSELKQITSESLTVTADVSRIKSEGEQNLTYTVALPDSVSAADVELSDKNPSRLTVTVERAEEKELEIDVEIVNEVAEGYVADLEAMTVSPEVLTVYGPVETVEQIESAKVTLDVGQVTDTVDNSFPYKLLDADGNEISTDKLRCSTDAVTVTLPVEKYKEIPLQIDFKEGGGATEENVRTKLTPEYITISGPASAVDSMDSLVVGSVNLATLTQTLTSMDFDIVMPAGVHNVSGESQVSAQITLIGLREKTLEVDRFELENAPEGLEASLKTTVLEITIRGGEEEIDAITADDLTVVVDLSTAKQSGTFMFPITITSDEYPDVGVVGSASVAVVIS